MAWLRMIAAALALRITASADPVATKPVLAGIGGGNKLAIFPSSIHAVPGSKEILLIAQGNPDEEMPHGGFGREFASKDQGNSWHEVGPTNPSDGHPRKGVACVTRPHDLLCIPFRMNPTASPNIGTATGMLWAGSPPSLIGNQTITVGLFANASGGMSGTHWGMVPDMDTPVEVQLNGKPALLLSLYGHYGGSTDLTNYHLIAVASYDNGVTWDQISVIKDNRGIDALGSCSEPSENALTRLPDGRLVVLYRNRDGAATGWSENIPLCMQLSSDEGQTWSKPVVVSKGPRGVEPKAAVISDRLVVLSGRDGLYAWSVPVGQVESGPWEMFNIAGHHNAFFNGTDLAFSQATVAGTGGSKETTAYMGLYKLSPSEALICYDRTTSHLTTPPHARHDAMAANNVFCFRISYPKDLPVMLV